jgi:hypothetical protein
VASGARFAQLPARSGSALKDTVPLPLVKVSVPVVRLKAGEQRFHRCLVRGCDRGDLLANPA